MEIASKAYGDCCNAAHLYGILSFAKYFSKEKIVISALDSEIVEHAADSLELFGVNRESLCVSGHGGTYLLTIRDRCVIDRVLSDFGYSGDEPNYRFLETNLRCEQCRPAFLAGCFLTGGTMTEPSKSYHLEFSTHKYAFFRDFCEMMSLAGIPPKTSERGALRRIAYFKDSSVIEYFLAYIGAHDAALNLINEKIYKEVVNRVNRQMNCENANIDKIILSSETDRKNIEYIFSCAGENGLSGELLEIARLRLEYPEFSLGEIGKLTDPRLSKSGVSHRLGRIRRAAAELRSANGE